jgi:hypothetical protein
MTDNGVSFVSVVHPRQSWWRSLLSRFHRLRSSSIETVEIDIQEGKTMDKYTSAAKYLEDELHRTDRKTYSRAVKAWWDRYIEQEAQESDPPKPSSEG